jgi:hypothetical protein
MMASRQNPKPNGWYRRFVEHLDPGERMGELLFGLIMVLTFTLGAGIELGGREEARELLIAVLGCNTAWGIIDAALYLMGRLSERGRLHRLARSIRAAPPPRTPGPASRCSGWCSWPRSPLRCRSSSSVNPRSRCELRMRFSSLCCSTWVGAGDKVVMWYVSANRDEAVFERPNELVIDRENARQHLAFGIGVHFCMGSRLAEMQLRVVWEETLARFRQVEVVGDPVRVRSNFVKGYSRLPVRVHPW